MAIPKDFDPNQPMYQVEIRATSGFKGHGENLDEYRRLTTFEKRKEIRDEVQAIRARVNIIKKRKSIPFFGAYLTNEKGMNLLIEACKQADQDMKKIDPTYHCTIRFVDIPLTNITGKKSLFDQIITDLRNEVFTIALQRMEDKIKKIPEGKAISKKSKDALLAMCDQIDGLNVVGDAGVNDDIEKIRARIRSEQFNELRDELLSSLENNKNRAEALELTGPGMAPVPAPEPAPEPAPAAGPEAPAEPAAPAPVIPLVKNTRSLDL